MWKLSNGSDVPHAQPVHSLNNCAGRQVWSFHPNAAPPQEIEAARKAFASTVHAEPHSADAIFRSQPLRAPRSADKANTVEGCIDRGLSYFETLQSEDGHWAGDYGGPMFLLPGLVFGCSVAEIELPAEHKKEMIRYLTTHQNKDGGWGLHIAGPSTMFASALNYCALRLLGADSASPVAVKARDWIRSQGGAVGVASWGKFWLSVLGVYEWAGVNPIPPEVWCLPYALPIHPGRYWCHCRMVYLPMSYLYGARVTGKITPVIEQLREELYVQPYGSINWDAQRNYVLPADIYTPHSYAHTLLFGALHQIEKWVMPKFLRRYSLTHLIKHLRYEDEQTHYVCIGPVSKILNMLCRWHDGDSEAVKLHAARLYDYLWIAEDGMKMQGYNGSQLWDTAFAVQGILDSTLANKYVDCLRRAHSYLDVTQVRENTPDFNAFYRHRSNGAWPFSTKDHGWPITDCTSEGLVGAIRLAELGLVSEPLSDDRLFNAVDVILSFQNPGSKGWATYENTRSYAWLEYLNPSEVFGDIMIDYPYVECSAACVKALAHFHHRHPTHRAAEVTAAIASGAGFLESIQRADGSWYGSWAVCFTYGTWFGVKGLLKAGRPKTAPAIRKAVAFLVDKQRSDGGWGESYLSSQNKVYVQHPTASQVVNTAWAVIALAIAYDPSVDTMSALDAGAGYLMDSQRPNGDWEQQSISGVFNANCMISYSNYKNIFPIWALGLYRSLKTQSE